MKRSLKNCRTRKPGARLRVLLLEAETNMPRPQVKHRGLSVSAYIGTLIREYRNKLNGQITLPNSVYTLSVPVKGGRQWLDAALAKRS